MNILIIRLSAIGDVVHTLPAVHLLKKHMPGCRITWVVEEAAAGLLDGYAGIDRVILSRRRQWLYDLRGLRLRSAASGMDAFFKDLRLQEYDTVLDFQGLLKSGMIAGLARGKRKIGFANAREGAILFYTEKVPAAAFNDHAIKRHMGLLRHMGIEDEDELFSPLYGPAQEAAVERLLAGYGMEQGDGLVCVHPLGTWPTKCWPEDRVAAFCDRLQQEYGCRTALVGSSADQPHAARIAAAMARPTINLAGATTLRELACLLARSALVLTMDSGPMHLACAVGTPVVALFGPTAPWRTGPFGNTGHSVIRKDLACSPCFARRRCPEGHHRCMSDITVEDVLQVCCNYLPAKT